MAQKQSILIVDDHDIFRKRMLRAFTDRNYLVFEANNAESALSIYCKEKPDQAILDLKMPGESGLRLLKNLKEQKHTCEILILTGYGSIATAVEAIKLGAINYLEKPADFDDIMAAFSKGRGDRSEEIPSYSAPSLERVEWEHIQRVLEDCGGNISETARRLKMHRRTLQRKLQKYPPSQ